MRTLAEIWDVVGEVMFENSDDLYAEPLSVEEAIEKAQLTDTERDLALDDHKETKLWEEYEAGNPHAEELKTYIPGVGMLVTNLSTAESHIFPTVVCDNKIMSRS